jgi:hypothetical protein
VTTIGRLHIRTRNLVLIAIVLGSVLGAVFLSHLTRLTPTVRETIVAALTDRFDGDVELEGFQISIFPRPEIWGEGLVVRYKGRRDVPPLISIRSFSAAASLVGLMGKPLHLKSVELEGLEVYIPPDRNDPDPEHDSGGARQPSRSIDAAGSEVLEPASPPRHAAHHRQHHVEELEPRDHVEEAGQATADVRDP